MTQWERNELKEIMQTPLKERTLLQMFRSSELLRLQLEEYEMLKGVIFTTDANTYEKAQ